VPAAATSGGNITSITSHHKVMHVDRLGVQRIWMVQVGAIVTTQINYCA
jgi:hypothetical protein